MDNPLTATAPPSVRLAHGRPCGSLDKERSFNHKEIAQQEKLIQRYKDEGRDEYDVKKQVTGYPLCRLLSHPMRAPADSCHTRCDLLPPPSECTPTLRIVCLLFLRAYDFGYR